MEIIYEDEKHIVRMDENTVGRYSVMNRRSGRETIHYASSLYWIKKMEGRRVADVIHQHYEGMKARQPLTKNGERKQWP